jgi:PBP1b-binding outer membrane lipoprotein LpoB
MNRKTLSVHAVVAMLLFLGGCSHYYKVSDPAGSKEYYTKDVDQTKMGAIKIKDAKTGATVTLQSSDVKEISEDEFNQAVKGQNPKP